MKGRMDVLNLTNPRSSKSSTYKDVIKIDTDVEREKENCDADLVIDMRNKKMDVDAESTRASMSGDDAEMDDDYEEEVISDLPMLSVIIKEEDNILNYHDDTSPSPSGNHSDVEIKYEDDIEEEEYDSEDSGKIREMPPYSSHPDKRNPKYVQTNKQAASFLNTFDSSILNFDRSPTTTDLFFNNGSRGNVQYNGSAGRGNDSVLLSIVYATINVPFSQVSKFLTAYHLSKSQLSVIRKVRRQVKNRLYAQNCRRRRIAHIKNLSDELRQMRTEKEKMCSLRHELLTKKEAIEKRYTVLRDHVMNAIKERCRSENLDSNDFDEEEIEEQYRQLKGERTQLEQKKEKLKTEYHDLYSHVFKVISERNTDSDKCFTKAGEENPFNMQLRNMNIVNELAMLNQYYTKNNKDLSGDVDSSVSVDGSRTSENKMNDFVDYESSVSADGSRTEENSRDELVDYESSMNDKAYAVDEHAANAPATSVITNDENNRLSNNKKENKKSVDDEEEETEEDDDDEELDSDIEEQANIEENLKNKRKSVQEQYTKLYDHVLKESEMNEVEFLKTFADYCIALLLKVPCKT